MVQTIMETIAGKLGLATNDRDAITQGLMQELADIAHLAETSTVASDIAVLRSRALPILAALHGLSDTVQAQADTTNGP